MKQLSNLFKDYLKIFIDLVTQDGWFFKFQRQHRLIHTRPQSVDLPPPASEEEIKHPNSCSLFTAGLERQITTFGLSPHCLGGDTANGEVPLRLSLAAHLMALSCHCK